MDDLHEKVPEEELEELYCPLCGQPVDCCLCHELLEHLGY